MTEVNKTALGPGGFLYIAAKMIHEAPWQFAPSIRQKALGRLAVSVWGSAMIRRLAAILAADIAGYSRLMHADEERTHAEFTAIMRGSVEPALARYGGRLVKSTGDGFLAEFPSAVEAVRCALHFQDDIARRMSDDAPNLQLAFRVGINLGDVIIEPHDVFGDGVNMAARLEALAEPGGILIAAAVYEQVRGRVACRLDDLGEQRVKNIATPIRLFRVVPSEQIAEAVTVPGKPSIVVLPFQNISGDPEQEYFADGMVEEITISLSRIRWLFVIARNSAFTYKGRFIDVRQVSRELGVALCPGRKRAEIHEPVANLGTVDRGVDGAPGLGRSFRRRPVGRVRAAGPGDRGSGSSRSSQHASRRDRQSAAKAPRKP